MNLLNFRRMICLVFLILTCSLSMVHAQSVSVPFPRGFIGTVGTSTGRANNILTFQTLGVVRGQFIQSSTNGQFGGTQGNDLSGTLRLVLANGSTIDVPGAINWKDSSGSTVNAFGFIPNPSNPVVTFTYGGGSVQTLDATSNYGLQLVASTVTYTDGTNVVGNASTSGLLDSLNAYLSTVTTSGPQVTGPTGVAGAAASAITVNENQTAVTTLTANRVVTWSIFSGYDAADFTINSTGVLTFLAPPDYEAPTDSDANNTYLVTVQAIDADGYTGQQTVTVTVADLDDTTVITGPSGAAGALTSTKSVPENQTAVHSFTADEPVLWDVIRLTGDWQYFFIDPITGALTFLVPPDFEAPTDFDFDNVYIVSIRALHPTNDVAIQEVFITVTDLDEVAPLILGPSGAAGDSQSSKSVPENQTAVHTFTADEPVTWEVIRHIGDWRSLTIDPATGALTFLVPPDFEAPADFDFDNVYLISIAATDAAGNIAIQDVTVTVADLDEIAPLILGPSGAAGDAASAISVPENQTAVHTFTADEPVVWDVVGVLESDSICVE